MDIGTEQPAIIVEPLSDPVPAKEVVDDPKEPVEAPVEAPVEEPALV